VEIPATSDNIPGTLVLRDATGKVSTGDLVISGSQKRIRGDFSSVQLVERVFFQCTNQDGPTSVGAIPNGTSNYTNFAVFSSNDVDNSPVGIFVTEGTYIGISATKTGTGSFFPFTISTGNQERLRIDTDGNVGIGTANPAGDFKLTISGSDSVLPGINALNNSTIFSAFAESTYGYVGTRSNHPLLFATNATERMRIDASGNVGIGTTNPTERLHVDGVSLITRSIYPVLQLQETGSTGVGQVAMNGDSFQLRQTQNFTMTFSTNNTERMRIAAGGNVGIGTTSPSSLLHVAGDLTLSSATTAASANAGGETLPANPVGFLVVSINGTSRKIPYYAT